MVEVAKTRKEYFKGEIEVVQIHSTEVVRSNRKQDDYLHVIERVKVRVNGRSQATLISCVEDRVTFHFRERLWKSVFETRENPGFGICDLQYLRWSVIDSIRRSFQSTLFQKLFPGTHGITLFVDSKPFSRNPWKRLIFCLANWLENNGGKTQRIAPFLRCILRSSSWIFRLDWSPKWISAITLV